jgi:hypothetical protein
MGVIEPVAWYTLVRDVVDVLDSLGGGMDGTHHLAEKPLEVAIFSPLKDNVQLIVFDKCVQVLDKVDVLADRLQHAHFPQALVPALGVHDVKDLDLLERHILPIGGPRPENDAKLAAAYLLAYFVRRKTPLIHRYHILQVIDRLLRRLQTPAPSALAIWPRCRRGSSVSLHPPILLLFHHHHHQ